MPQRQSVFHTGQTDDKPRFAAFAPSKPQGGLTERHENQSLAARPSRDLLLIFGAADFVSNLAVMNAALMTGQRHMSRAELST